MILGIYGASGLGTEYLQTAEACNEKKKHWDEIVFIDDTPEKVGKELVACRIISYEMLSKFDKKDVELIIAIGEPTGKDKVFEKVCNDGYEVINLFYPGTKIGKGAKLGKGIVIQDNSGVPPMAEFGNNILLQGKTALGHGIKLGDNVVISSFAFVGGDTEIGKNTYIAPHACLRNGIKIGSDAIIGMGSVVTKDIPDRAVAYGNPCTVVRTNESGKVFSK